MRGREAGTDGGEGRDGRRVRERAQPTPPCRPSMAQPAQPKPHAPSNCRHRHQPHVQSNLAGLRFGRPERRWARVLGGCTGARWVAPNVPGKCSLGSGVSWQWCCHSPGSEQGEAVTHSSSNCAAAAAARAADTPSPSHSVLLPPMPPPPAGLLSTEAGTLGRFAGNALLAGAGKQTVHRRCALMAGTLGGPCTLPASKRTFLVPPLQAS